MLAQPEGGLGEDMFVGSELTPGLFGATSRSFLFIIAAIAKSWLPMVGGLR